MKKLQFNQLCLWQFDYSEPARIFDIKVKLGFPVSMGTLILKPALIGLYTFHKVMYYIYIYIYIYIHIYITYIIFDFHTTYYILFIYISETLKGAEPTCVGLPLRWKNDLD